VKRANALACAFALGAGLLWSAPARAFCLTHGCSDKKQDCEYDARGCLVTGPLLHWASRCVSFDVQRSGSPLRGIGYDQAHGAIVDGFRQWLNADCGDGRGPAVTISDYGPVECHQAEYNQDSPNANIFMFRDQDWPYANAIDTLALTTLIFNADTGEIYDADVEVNTFQSPMSIGEIRETDIDFASVITHEIGHFLGLSHSNAQGSTMGPSYAPGQTGMSSIEQDDVDGVCTALPPDRETTSTSCDPRHGFSTECALGETTCAFARGGPSHRSAIASALLGLLGLSSTLLRRRSRPSVPRP
jgi:Matrixin